MSILSERDVLSLGPFRPESVIVLLLVPQTVQGAGEVEFETVMCKIDVKEQQVPKVLGPAAQTASEFVERLKHPIMDNFFKTRKAGCDHHQLFTTTFNQNLQN
jgi:hypothetical protein